MAANTGSPARAEVIQVNDDDGQGVVPPAPTPIRVNSKYQKYLNNRKKELTHNNTARGWDFFTLWLMKDDSQRAFCKLKLKTRNDEEYDCPHSYV